MRWTTWGVAGLIVVGGLVAVAPRSRAQPEPAVVFPLEHALQQAMLAADLPSGRDPNWPVGAVTAVPGWSATRLWALEHQGRLEVGLAPERFGDQSWRYSADWPGAWAPELGRMLVATDAQQEWPTLYLAIDEATAPLTAATRVLRMEQQGEAVELPLAAVPSRLRAQWLWAVRDDDGRLRAADGRPSDLWSGTAALAPGRDWGVAYGADGGLWGAWAEDQPDDPAPQVAQRLMVWRANGDAAEVVPLPDPVALVSACSDVAGLASTVEPLGYTRPVLGADAGQLAVWAGVRLTREDAAAEWWALVSLDDAFAAEPTPQLVWQASQNPIGTSSRWLAPKKFGGKITDKRTWPSVAAEGTGGLVGLTAASVAQLAWP